MALRKINASDLRRNNLDKSSSPYLLQHISNPVWWQDWNNELIEYANDSKKLLFVSVGYATCHWCHVMASEAFSDNDTANYLNSHFICIKVDREQRPDIDQFLMEFINNQNGRGGWPLNVFMTADMKPVYALTYAPVHTSDRMFSLKSIAERVHEFFLQNSERIPPFNPPYKPPEIARESVIGKVLSEYYDPDNGGFGAGQKFPPHSSLLYLLLQPDINESPSVLTICMKTLDAMQMLGLNDHLQGGIFRYCVDCEWTIPHFEKMLYDQSMALWCYSLAYQITGRISYKSMAEKILKCLEDCFKTEGFYRTALDADTAHEEGATYLWSYEQLKQELSPYEFEKLSETYYIEEEGNFEGMIHLIRRNNLSIDDVEKKLLSIRKSRMQPANDDKVLCGLNALLATALVQASRYLVKPDLENEAATLVRNLLNKFWNSKMLGHSFYRDSFQELSYLFDAAAMLTAISMLYENDHSWEDFMNEFAAYVETFKSNGKWMESSAKDFQTVYASWSDHPIPSSVSLAEMGLTRVSLLTGKEVQPKPYREPFISDFYNVTAMMNNGLFHVIESNKQLPWNVLPVNSIRIAGNRETDCFMGACRPIGNEYISK